MAQPGEFTHRAVTAGRMTLLDAEAVDLACRATSDAGLQIARTVFDGTLGASIAQMREALVFVAAELEARLDWPGDDLATMDDAALLARVAAVGERAARLSASQSQARLLVDGARVAFVGPANAGKSSLFNAMVGAKRALVHQLPGTTRDVVEASIGLGPLKITLYDTAGLRETNDPVEQAGLELAREILEGSDLLLLTVPVERWGESEAMVLPEALRDTPRLVVCNGVDRVASSRRPTDVLCTSAVTGEGQEALEEAVVAALLGDGFVTDTLRIASRRQAELLSEVTDRCAEVPAALREAGPAVAASVVLLAVAEVDGLTGADGQEDVLSSLFARFCIGK
jgi:tRNA modification GTPase